MRRGKAVCVATVALALALAAAPTGRADDGPPAGAASSAADAPEHSADAPGASGDAPAQADGSPGNSANAPGQSPDPPGDSGNAPGHASDGAGNSENAPGHSPSESSAAPAAEAEQGASIGQGAEAGASAEQGQVGNTHVTVRVDEPGNGSPVAQENRAEADAHASASADGAPTASVEQEVRAEAGATQSDVANTTVTVRVGSPGDDGGVSQSNAATAASTTSADPTWGDESANAVAGQDGAANTSVSVRVFSPGDDGIVTQVNEASAAADAGSPPAEDARASQDDVRNTSVSIRVESPGAVPQVAQTNVATAEAGGVAVAVSDDAVNTVVAVAVGATDLDRPGPAGLQVWIWEWDWQRDESESPASAIGADVTSWIWNWDDNAATPGRGKVTSRAAGDGDRDRQPGSWEWRWDWERQGIAGWSWSWDWTASLGCASCIWIWDWTWSWSGQPDTGNDQQAPVQAGNLPTGQLNVARAEAEAEATAQVVQNVAQDGSGSGTQYAGQLIQVAQSAEADATAVQLGVASVAWDDGTSQSNVVTSDATAILETAVLQDIQQVLLASDLAKVDQWSGQQVDVVQVGHAGATSSQRDAVLTRAGQHRAVGHAVARETADVEQVADQSGAVDRGSASQSLAQLALVEQVADANATAFQSGTARSRTTGGFASASAAAGGLARIDQVVGQAAVRDGGTAIQDAAQLTYVEQGATAQAATGQQAGIAASPLASSDALAVDRVWVAQSATQSSRGAADMDIQHVLQQSVVVQSATAVSTSNGGIAGSAVVVNCAVTQQAAAQSIGAGVQPAAASDLTAFCFPPAPGATPTTESAPPSSSAFASLSTGAPGAGELGASEIAALDEDPKLFRGRGSVAVPPREKHVARASAPFAPHHGRPLLGRAQTKLSAPHSAQARIDTRPGSPAGAGDAGREPPLPPVGDPPTWVSAFASAASSAGSSGIAAILLAFALVPPLMRRVPEGSVVRRPADVLAPIDVPV